MRTRKIIEVRNSQYVNIPREIREALNTKKGERLNVGYAPGVGIVMTQLKGADKIPARSKVIEELQREADFVYSSVTKKLRKMKDGQIESFHSLMMKEFAKLGIFDLKSRVDGLEKEAEKIKMGRGKLSLVGQRKRSP